MFDRNSRPRFLARTAASLITAFTAVVVGAAGMAPAAMAESKPGPGYCESGPFTATPQRGSGVAPGQTIVYHVGVVVMGGQPVLGCARDIRFSGPLTFVSVKPDGYYWPNTTIGAMATVSFDGPFDPGTRLFGTVVMRVTRGTSPGTVVSAESGTVIRYEVWAVH